MQPFEAIVTIITGALKRDENLTPLTDFLKHTIYAIDSLIEDAEIPESRIQSVASNPPNLGALKTQINYAFDPSTTSNENLETIPITVDAARCQAIEKTQLSNYIYYILHILAKYGHIIEDAYNPDDAEATVFFQQILEILIQSCVNVGLMEDPDDDDTDE